MHKTQHKPLQSPSPQSSHKNTPPKLQLHIHSVADNPPSPLGGCREYFSGNYSAGPKCWRARAIKNPKFRHMGSRKAVINPKYWYTEKAVRNPFQSHSSHRSLNLGCNFGRVLLTGHRLDKGLFSPSSIKRTTAHDRALVSPGILGCHSRDLLRGQGRRRILPARIKPTKTPKECKSWEVHAVGAGWKSISRLAVGMENHPRGAMTSTFEWVVGLKKKTTVLGAIFGAIFALPPEVVASVSSKSNARRKAGDQHEQAVKGFSRSFSRLQESPAPQKMPEAAGEVRHDWPWAWKGGWNQGEQLGRSRDCTNIG